MQGSVVSLKLFGFVARSFLILQMNYFGTFINAMTLNEYTAHHDPKKSKHHLGHVKVILLRIHTFSCVDI